MDPKRHREVDVDFPRPVDFHADTGVETYLWGNLKHQNTDGEISQSYICQISPNSVSAPAGCLDTAYLMHHLSHFFFPSVNIQLLGMFGDN